MFRMLWVEKGRSRSIRGDGLAIWIRDSPLSRLTFWRPAPVQRGLDRPWTSLHNPGLSYLPGPSSIVRLPARAQGRIGLRRSRPSNPFEAANQGGPGGPEVPAYSCLACAGRTARKRPNCSPPRRSFRCRKSGDIRDAQKSGDARQSHNSVVMCPFRESAIGNKFREFALAGEAIRPPLPCAISAEVRFREGIISGVRRLGQSYAAAASGGCRLRIAGRAIIPA